MNSENSTVTPFRRKPVDAPQRPRHYQGVDPFFDYLDPREAELWKHLAYGRFPGEKDEA